jgi:hypothetical protein
MKITGVLAEHGFRAFNAEPRVRLDNSVVRTWIVVADRHKAHIYRKNKGWL